MPQDLIGTWIYKRDTTGQIRKWRVLLDGTGGYYTEQGLDRADAAITTAKPTRAKPKNEGKANETTAVTQAEKEALAKATKKLKEGYYLNVKDIDKAFKQPMLATTFKDRRKSIGYPVGVECKLNGVRALYREQGKMVSRKNEEFHTVPHIIEVLDEFFPKGIQLDGEFFNEKHRENLNRITKLVSVARKDPTAEELAESRQVVEYYIYDAYNFDEPVTGKRITINTPFHHRRAAFLQLFNKLLNQAGNLPYLTTVKYSTAHSESDVLDALDMLVDDGHEGAIIRLLDGEYEHKRSTNLIKLKKFYDAEFKVLGVEEGKGNWAGCVKRVKCELSPELLKIAREKDKDARDYFHSNIEGDQEYLKDLWLNQDKIIGKLATVSYQNISEYGVPQLPYIRTIRDYE